MDTGFEGFADELSKQGRKIFEAAEPTIVDMIALAAALNMPTARENLEASLEGLRRPTFTMIVFGRFNTGKSTFLNVLLGRLERPLSELPRRLGAPLPMDDMPVNARVTTIRYGESPSVTVVRKNGQREVRSLRWFLDNSPLRATEQENSAAFGDIDEFELTYPFANGRAGIVLIDTPGTDEAPDRTGAALRALNQADAAILLFNTSAVAGEGEVKFAREMVAMGLTNYFTVINRYNGRVVDDRLRHLVWDKLVRGLKNGPAYSADRFAEERVYFVDALAALDGRLAGNEAKVAESGIIDFERALADFYEHERRKVHVQRWTDQALGQAAKIQEFVSDQIPTLMLEREQFQRLFEEVEPKARELANRKVYPKRIFDRFRTRAVESLINGFQELVFSIGDDMPKALEHKDLESLKGFSSMMWSAVSKDKQNEVKEEAQKLAVEYFQSRMNLWENAEPPAPGMRKFLEPLLEDFFSELRDEINRTEKDFKQLQLRLSNRMVAGKRAGADDDGEWWKRIAPAAAGLFFGPDMAVFGAQNGWKGFGKSLVVHTGVLGAIVLAATGPIGWGVLAAGWVASFVIRAAWSAHDRQREVKAQIVEAFCEGMRNQITTWREVFDKAIEENMRPLEATVTQKFTEEIDQQIAILHKQEKESALSRDEKAALLEQYTLIKRDVARYVETLTYVKKMAAV